MLGPHFWPFPARNVPKVWQYRDADPHFGSWQAKELSSHLKDVWDDGCDVVFERDVVNQW
jgi:hypothetical protein